MNGAAHFGTAAAVEAFRLRAGPVPMLDPALRERVMRDLRAAGLPE